jgi:hypothetical protein
MKRLLFLLTIFFCFNVSAKTELAKKMNGRYVPLAGCQIKDIFDQPYETFEISTGDDGENTFGVYGVDASGDSDRILYVKLDQLEKKVFDKNAWGDVYWLRRQIKSSYVVFYKPCPMKFCSPFSSWKEDGRFTLKSNGQVKVKIYDPNSRVVSECKLKRISN